MKDDQWWWNVTQEQIVHDVDGKTGSSSLEEVRMKVCKGHAGIPIEQQQDKDSTCKMSGRKSIRNSSASIILLELLQ
jgi:hypothetical protein